MGLAACSALQCPSLAAPEVRVPGPPSKGQKSTAGSAASQQPCCPQQAHQGRGGETRLPQLPRTPG